MTVPTQQPYREVDARCPDCMRNRVGHEGQICMSCQMQDEEHQLRWHRPVVKTDPFSGGLKR